MKVRYHPVEEAIVADWLGIPRPAAARSIRIDSPRWLRTLRAVSPRAVRPRRQPDGGFGPLTLASAVARLARFAVPARLAEAATEARFGAALEPYAATIGVLPQPPRLLLEVDWARYGSADFRPETYSLCDLPGFGVRVVVAEQESAEAYGYHHVAVGWLGLDELEAPAAGEVLRAWWVVRAASVGLERWDAVLATGMITEPQAEQLAESVWGEAPARDGTG